MTPEQFQDLLIKHLSRHGKWDVQIDQLKRVTAHSLLAMEEILYDYGQDLYRGLLMTQTVTIKEAENFKADFNEAFAAAKRGCEP